MRPLQGGDQNRNSVQSLLLVNIVNIFACHSSIATFFANIFVLSIISANYFGQYRDMAYLILYTEVDYQVGHDRDIAKYDQFCSTLIFLGNIVISSLFLANTVISSRKKANIVISCV